MASYREVPKTSHKETRVDSGAVLSDLVASFGGPTPDR